MGREIALGDLRAGRGGAAAEDYVRRGFWAKLAGLLGRLPFAEDAAVAYFCALDPATPARVRAVLIGALAYFILPVDMIPDFIAGLGFTDDASVLLAAVSVVGTHIRAPHRDRARRALSRLGRRGWSRPRPAWRGPEPPRAG